MEDGQIMNIIGGYTYYEICDPSSIVNNIKGRIFPLDIFFMQRQRINGEDVI